MKAGYYWLTAGQMTTGIPRDVNDKVCIHWEWRGGEGGDALIDGAEFGVLNSWVRQRPVPEVFDL